MKENKYPKLILPDYFDERAEIETPDKGYLNGTVVVLEDGTRYQVYFIDPTRLKQDLDTEVESGRPFLAETGLIILPLVTVENARAVLPALLADGFFESLKPM